jgi:nucleoside-diphosphate-sugar epimerase
MQTIIGAGGTIGNPLALELKQYTHDIRLVSRHPKPVAGNEILFPADVTDPVALRKAVAGSSIVYCVVGFEYTTAIWQKTWPSFMRSLTDACLAEGAKLVFFDNVYMYHPSEIPHMTESSKREPSSRKGKVREEVVQIIEEAGAKGLKYIIARSADFYGPDNGKSMLVETVLKNQLAGKKPQWMGRADQPHNFTYTPDAAKAVALLAHTDDAWNQVWHLPTATDVLTGFDWVKLFATETGGNPKPMVISPFFLKVLGLFIPLLREMPEMLYQYMQPYFFDSSKFMERFPEFNITPVKEGVAATVAWFKRE